MIHPPGEHGSTEERRWLAGYTLVVILITALPFILGVASQGSLWKFSGFLLGVEDGNSYIAKMRLGSDGAWLFKTPYTTAEQGGVLAFLPYLLLGKLAGGTARHEQLVALFHLFRAATGSLLIYASYDFIARFISNRSLRRLGLLLATLGGGLGWLAVIFGRSQLLGSLPLEFYSPESFGFLSLFSIPHLAFGRAMMLWGILAYLTAWRDGGSAHGLLMKCGVLWLLATLAQPLYGMIFGFVIFCHQLALFMRGLFTQDRSLRWLGERVTGLRIPLAAFILPAPFLVYNFYMFSADPFLKNWTEQNIILSPHPVHYLLAYGLLAPFAFAGLIQAWKGRRMELLMLCAWMLLFPVLAYMPFNLQRRLPEGVWLAFVVLALYPFERTTLGESKRPEMRLAWVLALAFPSTLILLGGAVFTALQPGRAPVFIPAAESRAFEFLDETSASGDVVLSGYEIGNALPAWADLRVVIGHGPESVGLLALQPKVRAFFQRGTRDEARLALLQEQNVRYVFTGPQEASPDWQLDSLPYLHVVYDQDGYSIYEVVTDSP